MIELQTYVRRLERIQHNHTVLHYILFFAIGFILGAWIGSM